MRIYEIENGGAGGNLLKRLEIGSDESEKHAIRIADMKKAIEADEEGRFRIRSDQHSNAAVHIDDESWWKAKEAELEKLRRRDLEREITELLIARYPTLKGTQKLQFRVQQITTAVERKKQNMRHVLISKHRA